MILSLQSWSLKPIGQDLYWFKISNDAKRKNCKGYAEISPAEEYVVTIIEPAQNTPNLGLQASQTSYWKSHYLSLGPAGGTGWIKESKPIKHLNFTQRKIYTHYWTVPSTMAKW